MTYDLKLSRSGDLDLDSEGRASMIGGAEQIAQQIRLTLSIFLGEWFLDTSFGVPYFESILGKGRSVYEIEAIIRKKVREVPGVQEIGAISVEVEKASRKATITIANIATDEGMVDRVVTTQGVEV